MAPNNFQSIFERWLTNLTSLSYTRVEVNHVTSQFHSKTTLSMILEQDHLRESTRNYQNGIISFSGPRQPKDKVHAKITQGVCGIISGVHKPMFCFLALPR